jgi:hypothetical protein
VDVPILAKSFQCFIHKVGVKQCNIYPQSAFNAAPVQQPNSAFDADVVLQCFFIAMHGRLTALSP